MLDSAETATAALELLASTLGVSQANPVRTIETPVELAVVDYWYLAHLVEKREDARERYANFILPTLRRPFEIWAVECSDGVRNR